MAWPKALSNWTHLQKLRLPESRPRQPAASIRENKLLSIIYQREPSPTHPVKGRTMPEQREVGIRRLLKVDDDEPRRNIRVSLRTRKNLYSRARPE